jgi:hypothetical protein
VELLNLEIKHPQQENTNLSTFHFDLKLQHRVNEEKKMVFVVTTIQVMNQDKSAQMAMVQSSTIFEVENIDALKGSDGSFQFPNTFLDEINSMAISTTRGIMYSEFRGTFLHKAVLPIFRMESLKKQNQ